MKDLICNSGASLHRPVGSMNFLATEPESRQRELTSGERAPSDKCGRSDGAWSMCGNREERSSKENQPQACFELGYFSSTQTPVLEPDKVSGPTYPYYIPELSCENNVRPSEGHAQV
ncbi:hypothetical protein CPSG_03472 [Coccidioides posadasii str. Silveira]|uniref:Uncharacterized protein n=1 Tax=Coccidioides posadasii (strain RMSCC 757 / Silveira) TaxID=443226 RepID=E9D044_COCPS|nr:hypothetical protein CPSG_03472 [Coccidioides posadasii str. Silveira]